MGAAVGKAAEDLVRAPKTQAAARLGVAEHAMLQWTRCPGADSGIWDAEAKYTNRGLLAAVDKVLLLAEEDPFPAADSSLRRRLDSAVGAATARLMEEFLRVRVWNASQSQLRGAVDKLALASSGAPPMAFPSAGDRASTASTGDGTSTASTGGELDASGGSQPRSSSSVPDEVVALLDREFFDGLDLIYPAGVSVLHEIALRVTRAGCTKEFLRAFASAPCDVLDRFLSIIQVECSRRTTADVIKRWATVAKLIGEVVAAMRRQLYAQNPGAFDGFRDEYLLAIAENRIWVLLRFADGFTSIASHEKLVYILGMYEALSDAAPSLLLLSSGAHKELVSRKAQHILAKLAVAARTMVSGLMAKIASDSWRRASATDGVHPLARYAMNCVEQLAPHRSALDLILAAGDEDEAGAERVSSFVSLAEELMAYRAGDEDEAGAKRVSSFVSLAAELIASLERVLEEESAGGSRRLFLANNTCFVLNRAADAGVAPLLGDGWAGLRRQLLKRHTASYVEASWGPVAACLETAEGACGKPAKALARFNAAFKEAHGSQVRREVPDPALRADLRAAVREMLVPAYAAFLQQQPKLEKSVRYTVDNLAESLSELFEGEAANGRKS